MVCEEILDEIIVCLPTSDVQVHERSHKRRKKSASIDRPVSTCGGKGHGRRVPSPGHGNVMKDGEYSRKKMRIDHAEDGKPWGLRRSSRLSQKTESQEYLPERARGIITDDISGRIQFDSTGGRTDAADDEIISIVDSPHYQSDECEAMVEVLALERQQSDNMPQMEIITRLEEAEEDRLKSGQSSIPTTNNNEYTPKAVNSNTGNIPVQSHDRLHTTPEFNNTVAILGDASDDELAISSLTTTKEPSLPGIESFQPDALEGQKIKHSFSLRDLHERSFETWFTNKEPRWKQMQAQTLSVTKDVAPSNTTAEYHYLWSHVSVHGQVVRCGDITLANMNPVNIYND
ncbi:hypothetical protein FAGAP_969 [Fusarium agapanthi]|uniref:Uncharacterized protein n=1 Tax=Fusarium agapanthi TaxID=1803897 RepID=A0A9P5BJ71_9HYPO|nr:hypothetical protein FAGAP_969 [Fusarium agapanthi]